MTDRSELAKELSGLLGHAVRYCKVDEADSKKYKNEAEMEPYKVPLTVEITGVCEGWMITDGAAYVRIQGHLTQLEFDHITDLGPYDYEDETTIY